MFRKPAVVLAALAMTVSVACARTDAGVTASVKSKLAADDTVKASEIDVSTLDHAVTLDGTVANRAIKERALAIARDTDGVETVIDDLVVSSETAATTGTDVPEPASDRDGSNGDDIDDQAKDKTADAGSKASGAADRAGNAVTDAAITAAVKTKLLGDSKTPGMKIDVDTQHGVVTLSGEVANASERTNAVKVARGTDGVKRVVNKLTIAKHK
jgi:hyperosmotically inducible periplasmic protein